MNKETGGPAFPFKGAINDSSGMTLRDYFAAKAMQAIVADHKMVVELGSRDVIAESAYNIADAMLKARRQE